MHKLHHTRPQRGQRPGQEPPGCRRPRIAFRPMAGLGWLFVTFILATGPLQLAVPDQSGSAYFSAAGLGGLAVLGALLAADLRRARAMTRAGLTVERVDVGLLRGRVVAAGEVGSPQSLRRVSWAGPLVLGASASLLAILGGLLTLAGSTGLSLLGAAALMTAAGIAALGLSELLPAPGSPGSQLVYARAWRRSGQRDTALLSATRAGVASGWFLLLLGIALLTWVSLAGIWLMLIGGVVIGGSRLTLAGAQTRQRLAGLRAADVMSPPPPEVSSFASAGAAFTDVALPSRVPVLIVREPDGSFGGLVPVRALAAVPGDDRGQVRVRRLAIPASAVATVTPGERMERVLELIAAHPLAAMAVVMQDASDRAGSSTPGPHPVAVGVVTPADLARTIDLMDAAHPGAGKRSAKASWLRTR